MIFGNGCFNDRYSAGRLWTAETFSRMVHRPDRGKTVKEPVSGMV